MKHNEHWREFILAIVLLAMMFAIVCLSFTIENKNREIERLQRRVWEYQEKNTWSTQPNGFDDFEYLRKR